MNVCIVTVGRGACKHNFYVLCETLTSLDNTRLLGLVFNKSLKIHAYRILHKSDKSCFRLAIRKVLEASI